MSLFCRVVGVVVAMRGAVRALLVASGVALLAAASLAVGAPAASAAITHNYLCQITGTSPGSSSECSSSGSAAPGGLSNPYGITISGGELWVASPGTPAVDEFDSTGAFVSQQTGAGHFSGGGFVRSVAVDDSSGDMYVADSGPDAVDVFDSTGGFVTQWNGSTTPSGSFGGGYVSAAVDNSTDASSGDVYVTDSSDEVIDQLDANGNPVAFTGSASYISGSQITGTPSGPFAFNSDSGDAITVDSSGNIYVADNGNGVVDEFSSTGVFVQSFTGSSTPAGSFGSITSVAVNSATGDVFVVDQGRHVVDEFASTGSFVGQITGVATPAGSWAPNGVAVDASGNVFVSDGAGDVVDEFGSEVVVPDVSTGSASGVQPTSAMLNGTVNPDGIALTDCHFEYGTDTSYSAGSVPCQDGSGNSLVGNASTTPVAVQADISGLTSGTMYHFRLVAANANGPTDGADQVFGPPVEDSLAAAPVGQTTATLSANVNPEGVETTYHFEYGTTTSYGTSIPVPDADVGSGSTDVAVSQNLTGLVSGQTYHYRLVATNAAGMVSSPDQTFTTIPPATISGVQATNLAASSVTLNAQVNPLGSDTTCSFQYGTETSYGNSVACSPADVGAGNSDVAVSQQITGLTQNTEYHWRVVATNAAGRTTSPDHTFSYPSAPTGPDTCPNAQFRTGPSASLPDCRAYEMVTPAQKNGAAISHSELILGQPSLVASSGDRVEAATLQCFGAALSCAPGQQPVGVPYFFTRTSGGWQATSDQPPAGEFAAGSDVVDVQSGDAVLVRATPPADEADFYLRESDGTIADIGPATPPVDGALGDPTRGLTFGFTIDFSTFVYEANSIWPGSAGTFQLYEYTGTGNAAPTLVGVSGGAGSTDLISSCATSLGAKVNTTGFRPVSSDGSMIYFTAAKCASGTGANATVPVPASTLYARIDESRTVLISGRSPTGCTTPACQSSAPADAVFAAASLDGSKALFTSTQQLTDDATQGSDNLYLYDFDNPAGHELIDVSAGDTSGTGPGVEGVAATSDDGSHVYFAATGVLTSAANEFGQTAQAGANNLYLYERDAAFPNGRLTFITALAAADSADWHGQPTNVSPDGRYLVFGSVLDLTPDTTSTGLEQVFRYDAQTGQLIRVSIGNDGYNDNGNEGSGDASIAVGELATPEADGTMSADGTRVFFQSPNALVPGALNDVTAGGGGLAPNIYEWEQAGSGSCPAGQSAGCVYLISDGQDVSGDLKLLGTDTTGSNVFFVTADALVPQDTDTQIDIYDARIDGGFPAPPSAQSCSGDTCQGQPGAAPSTPTVATVTFSGPGNIEARPAKSHSVSVVKRSVVGPSFSVTVKVPASGRITVSGDMIKPARKSVVHAGSYQVRVKLTKAARRLVARRHRLKLTLHIAYAPRGGKTSHLALSITDTTRGQR